VVYEACRSTRRLLKQNSGAVAHPVKSYREQIRSTGLFRSMVDQVTDLLDDMAAYTVNCSTEPGGVAVRL